MTGCVGLMKTAALVVALCAALSCASGAERVELNDWRFSDAEDLATARMFTLQKMADWLDDMGRDMMEMPSASRRPLAPGPVVGNHFNEPDFDDSEWERVSVPHDAAIRYSFSYDLGHLDGYLPASGTTWYRCRFTVKDCEVRAEGKE